MALRRRAPRRKRARKARGRKSRVPRSIAPRHQMASCSETIEFQNITANNYVGLAFNLGMFSRSNRMSTLFRWYKATHVTWTIEPMFNTYQSTALNSTIPYVYTIMNRTQDKSALILNDLLAQGAKPRKLTSVVKTSYKPNWCSPGLLSMSVVPIPGGFGGQVQNIVQQGMKPEFGWLATPGTYYSSSAAFADVVPVLSNIGAVTNAGNNQVGNAASLATYNGHGYYVEQKNPPSATIACKITCKVNWVFKDPKYTQATTTDDVFSFDVSGNAQPSVPDV